MLWKAEFLQTNLHAKKISVFEIDTVGEKLFGKQPEYDENSEPLIHKPTVHLPREKSESNNGDTRIYSVQKSDSIPKESFRIMPKPFEMDEPEDGKKKPQNFLFQNLNR